MRLLSSQSPAHSRSASRRRRPGGGRRWRYGIPCQFFRAFWRSRSRFFALDSSRVSHRARLARWRPPPSGPPGVFPELSALSTATNENPTSTLAIRVSAKNTRAASIESHAFRRLSGIRPSWPASITTSESDQRSAQRTLRCSHLRCSIGRSSRSNQFRDRLTVIQQVLRPAVGICERRAVGIDSHVVVGGRHNFLHVDGSVLRIFSESIG